MYSTCEELPTLRSQSAVKIPPSNLAKGSTFAPSWSSQNTVLSEPLKASVRTLERVEDIWSTLKNFNEIRRSLCTTCSGTCIYLKLRVCGRKLRMNCCSILESTGSGPHDSNAFSKLSSGEIACYNEADGGQIERMGTHSNALSSPSTLPRRLVNLHIKAYTNSDSHLSDGCFAFEGGQMCPFLSTCCAAAMLQPNGVKDAVKSCHGVVNR